MKPPFGYYGGKQRIVRHIIPLIPQHTVYAEPFCGGATVLFTKPDYTTGNNNHYREAINDTNSDVYNFFLQLKTNKDRLINLIEHSLYSQKEYRIAKSYNGTDLLLRAYYFYINVQQSFAHKLNSGWGICKYSKNGCISYHNATKRLNECAERIKRCYICEEDALRFIERWDSPQTFFYCDPPYPGTEQGHYSGYTQKDFENLLGVLNQCKGSFILSCYPNASVPKDWEKVEISATCSVSNPAKGGNRTKKNECLWVRQAKEEPRKEILKIYEKQKQLELFRGTA